jgi:hypothetical protein
MPSLKRTAKGFLKRLLSSAPAPAPKKKVWRISERAPAGEWVDPDTAPSPLPRDSQRDPGETSSGGWHTSSMDLLSGTRVIEDDDIPPEPQPEAPTLPLRTRAPKK